MFLQRVLTRPTYVRKQVLLISFYFITIPGGWMGGGWPAGGIETKTNSFQLNLPVGTELGNMLNLV